MASQERDTDVMFNQGGNWNDRGNNYERRSYGNNERRSYGGGKRSGEFTKKSGCASKKVVGQDGVQKMCVHGWRKPARGQFETFVASPAKKSPGPYVAKSGRKAGQEYWRYMAKVTIGQSRPFFETCWYYPTAGLIYFSERRLVGSVNGNFYGQVKFR